MNDPAYDIELIERYFDKELTEQERAHFEKRLQEEPGFKRIFEQQRHVIGALRLEGALNELEYLRAFEEGGLISIADHSGEGNAELNSQSRVRRLVPYLVSAAACLLIIVVAIFYMKSQSPQQLASKYSKENLVYLSPTMSEASDSLQLGIAAFNTKDYRKASDIFGSLARREGSLEAIKNLGLTYLALGEYDKALDQFGMLAGRDDVYVNPGLFYKAVTLMLRSAPGDEEVARELLQQVVSKQLPGHEIASSWLERW